MVTLLYHGNQIGPVCRWVAEASKKGKIQILRDTQVTGPINGTVIRWDSTKAVQADKELNRAEAVKLSRNKRDSRLKMVGLAPTTWTSWLRERKEYTYPCIVRARRHHAAQKFYVCNNLKEVEKALSRCGYQKWYISPLISKKLEYRVFVFQGRVVKVVRRWHDDPNQVAWNIANGGKSVRVVRESWPLGVCYAAIKAGDRIGLDWYAADVILDQNDHPYVLELNTAPGLGVDKTMKRMARVFVWASENGSPKAVEKFVSWKDLIHPRLFDETEEETNGQA